MAESEQKTYDRTDVERYVGQSVPRLEDDSILSGESAFIDDIELPGMLYAKIYRSPFAHATIVDVDVSNALAMDGVVDAISGKDAERVANHYGTRRSGFSIPDRPPMASTRVRFMGEGVAAVAAESPYQAEDALEKIDAKFDKLPNIIESDHALSPETDDEIIHPKLDREEAGVSGNSWGEYNIDIGDVDHAFEIADHIVSHKVVTNRATAVPMEPHGAIADYNTSDGKITLYTSTQEAHQVRRDLAGVLNLPFNKVHVRQPTHMGGGFGHKLGLHEHEIVASILSIRTGRPVKIVLSRPEVFQATRVRQSQHHSIELALSKTGDFLGIRDEITAQSGGYAAESKPGMIIAAMFVPTPYRFENIRIRGRCVFTNTSPTGPYRGFGLTQATIARESIIDKAAYELGVNPWEIRKRNVIPNAECPTTHPMGYYLDSCGVDECLDLVKEAIDNTLLEDEPGPGKSRGLGVSTAMHVSSMQRPSYTSDNSAITIQLYEDGTIAVKSDQCPMGTGIKTSLAQIIADELTIDYRAIEFRFGDSDDTPYGLGSWGSRGITLAGSAAFKASKALRHRLVSIAAYQLDVPIEQLQLTDGVIRVTDDPGRTLAIEEIAFDAHYNGKRLPDDMTAGPVIVTESFDSPAPGPLNDKGKSDPSTTYPTNAHAAIVEVDHDTGRVEILDYAIGDDVGRVINPMIVEGQVQGGTVQGFGMAFGEHLQYDASGQLVNGTMEHYRLPLISETPMISKIFESDTLSKRSLIGAKGVGESGAITAPVTVLNAVNDALINAGIDNPIATLPLDPERVYSHFQSK